MPEYTVHASGYANAWTRVTADSVEEAVEQGYEMSPFLCHQCASDRYSGSGLDFGDEWVPNAVFDEETGECVWTDAE